MNPADVMRTAPSTPRAEVNLVTGAAGTYLPRALGKVAVDGLAW